ncbi:hypothetical protein DFH08DRAFT_813145 [Mycena albidolilacea]|uniref:Uncharacterized protein n=1 Tax=Mycena albidolilacea TaxID=1033008 RepID=A0AAD6ZTI4_9AGAR|nr:hypothetical protein DFH08DRAFT_813145 [Mycena albidolilacea]
MAGTSPPKRKATGPGRGTSSTKKQRGTAGKGNARNTGGTAGTSSSTGGGAAAAGAASGEHDNADCSGAVPDRCRNPPVRLSPSWRYLRTSALLLCFLSSSSLLSFMDPSGNFGSAEAAWGGSTPYDNSGSSADTSSFQPTSADDTQPPYSQTPAPPNTEAMLWSMLQEMHRDSHGAFQLYSQQQGETTAALNNVSAALAGLTTVRVTTSRLPLLV